MRSRTVRDREGFIWFGMLYGLVRFDGASVREYQHDPKNKFSIPNNYVTALLVDRRGRLWVGTANHGVCVYDAARDRFQRIPLDPTDSAYYRAKSVEVLLEDRTGTIWIGSYGGGIVRLDGEFLRRDLRGDSVADLRSVAVPLPTPRNTATDLLELDDGRLLAGSDRGLWLVDTATLGVSPATSGSGAGIRPDTALVIRVRRDSRGSFWVGTRGQGLLKLDRALAPVAAYTHTPDDPASLSSARILDVAEDPSGLLWVSSSAGLELFSPATGARQPYLTASRAPSGPTIYMALSVEKDGTLWVASVGGVYWLSPKSRAIPHYGYPASNPTSPVPFETIERDRGGNLWISSRGKIYQVDTRTMEVPRVIDIFGGRKPAYDDLCTFIDRRGRFWYGSWGLGLFRVELPGGRVTNYGREAGLGVELTAGYLAQAAGDSLWVASRGDGLVKFDPGTGRFAPGPDFSKAHPWSLFNDSRGRLWVTTASDGIYFSAQTGAWRQFRHDPSDPRSLADDVGRVVYEDPSGRIWVTAGNVLHLWDSTTNSFTRYPNPGMSQAIFAAPIGADRRGRIWVDYLPAGLSEFDPATGAFRNFDPTSGFSININRMETLEDGRILVTTDEGLHLFHPDSAGLPREPPPLVITRFTVNDEPAAHSPSPGGGILRLPHDRNVLEFEFAALDYDAPNLVSYRYRLDGLEADWVHPMKRRFVRYPGLPPGEYVFRVRAASAEQEWPERELAVTIAIEPPWWRTWWAYTVWSLVAVGMVYGGVRLRLKQMELKQKARMEHMEADRLIELDRLKSRFFANISHEFRTPLTLILGHLAKWKDDAPAAELRRDLTVAERNAHRLLRLINQLLDLSRLDAGAMKLRAANTNIVPVVKGIANSFESSAGMRGIALNVDAPADAVEIYCDRDMLEKILGNLLSNAFKFTPRGGSVSVSVAVTPAPPTAAAQGAGRAGPGDPSGDADPFREGYAEIAVSDTGRGIPAGELERVFDRFYQVDASQTREHEGSGIGLALVKELVDLHRGTIGVTSEEGNGATFTVRLPRGRGHLRDDQITGGAGASPPSGAVEAEPMEDAVPEPGAEARAKRSSARAEEAAGPGSPARSAGGRRPTVLVVEDNLDVREYIKGFLFSDFEVLEACDGADGVERALEIVPDLVISDVMMPKKDGHELCRTLKLDERTNHVPIILLTARAGVDNKVEGLETGADDYVVKPFEPKELLARARNLIAVRRALREKFAAAVTLRPGEIAVPSMDDAFLTRVREAVERHMGEEGFSVEDLSREAGLSRSQLLRKLTVLTGMSARDFIRYLRLQRGMDLLRRNAATVSEIAYMVGFGSPAHFTKCFHEQFGITPSEARGTPS